jgi:hypothetical protein
MFALSVVGSLALGRSVGVGGVGSLLAGTAVAARVASRPVFTAREAFQRAFPAVLTVFAAVSLLLGFGATAQGLELRGMARGPANGMAVVMLLGESVLWAVALSAVSAPIIARRARALRDRATAAA